MNKTLLLLPLVAALVLPGCRDSKSDTARSASATVTAKPPARDDRSQYDLARAITEVERMRPEEAVGGYKTLRRDWRGKRYRWRVYRIAALCPSAERCNVLPFDLAGKDHKKVVQGWMPSLKLSDERHAALAKKCAGQSRCSFEFEGTLEGLVLSTERLTSLEFSDVEIL